MIAFGDQHDVLTEIRRVETVARAVVNPWDYLPLIAGEATAVDYAALTSEAREWRRRVVEDRDLITLVQGEMLLYFYDLSMDDGIARDVSCGFFDECNRPPPMLWISHVEDSIIRPDPGQVHFGSHPRYIAAWIPESYRARAQSGVSANAERCLYWIGERECQWLLHASSTATGLAKCSSKEHST